MTGWIDRQDYARTRSQSEVGGDLATEAADLISSEQSASRQQSTPGHWLERGDIGVGLVVSGQSGISSKRYVGLFWTRGPRDRYDRDVPKPYVQCVDAEHDRRMHPEIIKVDVPYLTAKGLRQRHRVDHSSPARR